MSSASSPKDTAVPPTVYVRPASLSLSARVALSERFDAICIDLQVGCPAVEVVEEVIHQSPDVVVRHWINNFGVWVPITLVRRDPWAYLGHLRHVRVCDESVPEGLRDPRPHVQPATCRQPHPHISGARGPLVNVPGSSTDTTVPSTVDLQLGAWPTEFVPEELRDPTHSTDRRPPALRALTRYAPSNRRGRSTTPNRRGPWPSWRSARPRRTATTTASATRQPTAPTPPRPAMTRATDGLANATPRSGAQRRKPRSEWAWTPSPPPP